MSDEANRRPGSNGTHAQTDTLTPPDPQVIPKAERRRFSAEYKQRILAEADACTERGQIGALLRREGLYSSHLDKWRTQRARGVLQALTPHKRGPKPVPRRPKSPSCATRMSSCVPACSEPSTSLTCKKN